MDSLDIAFGVTAKSAQSQTVKDSVSEAHCGNCREESTPHRILPQNHRFPRLSIKLPSLLPGSYSTGRGPPETEMSVRDTCGHTRQSCLKECLRQPPSATLVHVTRRKVHAAGRSLLDLTCIEETARLWSAHAQTQPRPQVLNVTGVSCRSEHLHVFSRCKHRSGVPLQLKT